MLYDSVLNNNNDELEQNTTRSGDEDDFLSELVKEYESDDTVGKCLENEKLAKLVDKMFRCKLSEKNLKDRLERQERPANCTSAKPPRVNPGIWRRLREPTKKRDLQFFKIQQALTKGILPVVRIMDKLMQAKSLNAEECQDLKKQGLEAMSLLTHASYEINMQRRLLLRPDIGREYSALCSSQLPFTDFLFGDDLQKHLKDIGDQNKIGAKITPNYKGQRPSPGRPGNNSYKQSKKLERPQLQTLEIQKQCQPGQDNPDKPIEYLLPATSTVSICSPLCNNVYTAGNIAKHFSVWQTLTSDPYILSIVQGCQLEFCNPPCQVQTPRAVKLSSKETDIATTEIQKLLTKGVIRKAAHVPDEFISTIFTRPKKDGSHRLILNLKKLNEHIQYRHFKMDSLHSAIQLMKPNCWMAVLDLHVKDAYYSVPIRTEDRKYLRLSTKANFMNLFAFLMASLVHPEFLPNC